MILVVPLGVSRLRSGDAAENKPFEPELGHTSEGKRKMVCPGRFPFSSENGFFIFWEEETSSCEYVKALWHCCFLDGRPS